jgi:hypothetical protein
MKPTYQKNNIIFRIASAEAISNFKAAQAASFLQLARKELGFDTSAKEIILLEFDRFSHWALKIEKACLGAGGKVLDDRLIMIISEYFTDELSTIESVTSIHKDIFSEDARAFSKIIHAYSREIVLTKLSKMQNHRIDSGFVEIIKCISDYLTHLLLSFHEFNNNLISKTDDPFICGANFCRPGLEYQFIPETNRIIFFIEHNVGQSYVFKNYSDQLLFGPAVDHFDQLGIIIIPEAEIFNDAV